MKQNKSKVKVILDPNSKEAAMAFAKAAKAFVAEHVQTKESAEKILQELGIHTAKGNLTKAYR